MIMKVIRDYEESSGQLVNRDKIFFLTAPKICASGINRMRQCTGFLDKDFPVTYLGCPLYIGRKKIAYFDNMVHKVIKRLNGWQGNMISPGGRMVLIKNVLQSIPIYTLSIMSPPKATFHLIEIHFANFFWGSSGDQRKYHWRSWKNLSFHTDEGGIGIRRMEDISEVLATKRWWRFRAIPSLWANFINTSIALELTLMLNNELLGTHIPGNI